MMKEIKKVRRKMNKIRKRGSTKIKAGSSLRFTEYLQFGISEILS